jgi:hypothetical protein
MDYYELTLKVPKPTRQWLRFRIRTLLIAMFVVALILLAWRNHHESKQARLWRALHDAQAGRDRALIEWRRANASTHLQGRNGANKEALARSRYFLWRDMVELRLQQLADNGIKEAPPSN